MSHLTAGKIVVNCQDSMLRIEEVMHNHLAERREGLAEPFRDPHHLVNQGHLFLGSLCHAYSL